MGKNIEIKARCPNPIVFEEKLKLLSTSFEGEDVQVDTFYMVPNGRLKLRESKLYGNLLIPYLRADKKGPTQADYSLVNIEDAEKVKSLLVSILGVKGVVRKKRRIYLYENVRIHVDKVDQLGSFLELEAVVSENDSENANREKVEFLLDHFEIKRNDLIEKAYIDLIGI